MNTEIMIAAAEQPSTIVLVVAALLAISEVLALSSKVKSNSIFQLVVNVLRKVVGKED